MTGIMLGVAVYCYAGGLAGSAGAGALNVLSADLESGELRLVQTMRGVDGTSYLQLDRARRYLYSFVGDERDGAKNGTAVRFRLEEDGRVGKMERLADLPCPTPCHLSLSPDGRWYAFANYGAGTAGALPVGGGKVASYVLPDDAMGPNAKRQKKAYAHFTFFTPDSRRLGVIDLGCDRIRFFDPATMAVDASMEIRAEPGDGPRHAVWSKDGRFLFVVNELGSSVSSHAFDGRTFRFVGKESTLPKGFNRWMPDGETLATKAAAIRLTADGRLLLASNRGHDSIAFFSVDPDSGRLALKNVAKLKGRFPRDFALMPGERFLIVGHKLDDEIQSYRVDRELCTLTPVGAPVKAWRPCCFVFGNAVGKN